MLCSKAIHTERYSISVPLNLHELASGLAALGKGVIEFGRKIEFGRLLTSSFSRIDPHLVAVARSCALFGSVACFGISSLSLSEILTDKRHETGTICILGLSVAAGSLQLRFPQKQARDNRNSK